MTLRSLAAVALLVPTLAVAETGAAPAPDSGTGGASSAGGAKPPARKRSRAAVAPRVRSRRTLQVQTASARAPARAVPADLAARPLSSAGAPATAVELGLLGGYEADRAAGLSLRADGVLPLYDLGRRIRLAAVASVGWSRLSEDVGVLGVTADVLKLVPAARFSVPVADRLSLCGDAGVGFAYVRARIVSRSPAFPLVTTNGTLNLMARIGAGAWYDVGPGLRLGAMAELDPILGDFGYTGSRSQNTLLLLAGAMLRL